MRPESPPFLFKDENGDAAGLIKDITDALSEGSDLNFTFVDDQNALDLGYTGALSLLAPDGEYDAILWDYYPQSYRAKLATFSDAWAQSIVATLKLKTSASNTVQEAVDAGETVCTVGATAQSAALPTVYDSIQLLECDALATCIEELKAGNCSLYTGDLLALAVLASEDDSLELVNEKALPDHFYVSFVSVSVAVFESC